MGNDGIILAKISQIKNEIILSLNNENLMTEIRVNRAKDIQTVKIIK